MVKTYENTKFPRWWKLANAELAKLGCREATFSEAHDAYELGESPDTFAGFVHANDDWRVSKVTRQ